MNEVTKIHLGRQAFTIAVDAHKELRAYLDAIQKQVGESDVVEEVELRMAELLAERGITDNKVILSEDVAFLKEHLGTPKDFTEAEAGESTNAAKPSEGKRLYRDTENGMVAGVAAGLAQYFGVDVLLIRLLFVIAIFTGGWGILVYAVLWILVPEAKSPSDHLQMLGKAVTVNSLREVVERADIKGAARRANNSLAGPINHLFRVLIKVTGIAFVVVGLSLMLSLAAFALYYFLHISAIQAGTVFPSGVREQLLVDIVLVVAALISLFVIIFGMAMFRRKWPIHAWITGVLVGLICLGTAASVALAADVAPRVHDRYQAHIHSTTRTLQPFTKIDPANSNVDLQFVRSSTYSVRLSYYDSVDVNTVKTTVQNGVLLIDTSGYNDLRHCTTICFPTSHRMLITVYGPDSVQFEAPVVPDQVDSSDFLPAPIDKNTPSLR